MVGLGFGDERLPVYALAVSGSDLYAGGDFTTAGGKVSAYVAKANLAGTPVAQSSLRLCRTYPGRRCF